MCVVNLKSVNKLDLTWKQSFLINVTYKLPDVISSVKCNLQVLKCKLQVVKCNYFNCNLYLIDQWVAKWGWLLGIDIIDCLAL